MTHLFIHVGFAISTAVVPISVGTVMFLLGIATCTAGLAMLARVKCKRVTHHSSQPPPSVTDRYEMVNEVGRRAPPGEGVYAEVGKQVPQTDRHTNHYQELVLAMMERNEYATIKT